MGSNHYQNSKAFTVWLWCSLDLLLVSIAMTLCLSLRNAAQNPSFAEIAAMRISLGHVWLFGLFLPLWIGIHHLCGLHSETGGHSLQRFIVKTVCAGGLGALFFLLFTISRHRGDLMLREVITFVAVSVLSRLCIYLAVRHFSNRNSYSQARVLIIGSGPLAVQFSHSLTSSRPGAHVVGFVDTPGSHETHDETNKAIIGPLENLESVLMQNAIDEVVVALPMRSCYDQIQICLAACERVGVPAAYALQPFRHELGYARVENGPIAHYRWKPSRDVESDLRKRVVDLVGATAALILLSPLLLLIAIAVKLTSRGPIFFVQERYGLNKRRFPMYKFRTMVVDAEAQQMTLEAQNEAKGPVFKIKQDPRVTPLGRFLRKTSLDELPQFLNVLKGDMSIVGPRPLPTRDVRRFSDAWLMRRFSVKPGLTCLWQVMGRSNTSFDEWITLDLKYIDNWSPLLDISIMAKTLPAVVRGSGAM